MPQLTLSAEQFYRVCTSLSVPVQPGEDRRRARRVEFRAPISVALTDGATVLPQIPSTLRDFSPGGATLSHPTPLKIGSRIVWYLGDESKPIRIVATVIHSKSFADGTALIGLEFDNFIDPTAKKPKAA